jgi:hypothetical protein
MFRHLLIIAQGFVDGGYGKKCTPFSTTRGSRAFISLATRHAEVRL